MFKKENKIHLQGEILLRLSSEKINNENIMFKSFVGGAELNVASALSGLGHKTNFYSILPNNFIGNYVVEWLKNRNINIENIYQKKGNMGVYFINSNTADIKKNNISYSRENTAYIKYSKILLNKHDFKENDILHISGINSLIDISVHNNIIKILKEAKKNNVFISFDFNYREKINSKEYAKKAYLEILEYADIIFANIQDFTEILEFDVKKYSNIFQEVMKMFNIKYIAHSNRFFENNQHGYQSVIHKNDGQKVLSEKVFYELKDRVGGGDAFAAGILDGIIKEKPLKDIVKFSNELAIYKQAKIYGDNIYIYKSKRRED